MPLAGKALRRGGTHISYAPAAGSSGRKALGVFEATSIFTYAMANVLLPEVLFKTQAQATHCTNRSSAVLQMPLSAVHWLSTAARPGMQIQSVVKPPAVTNGRRGFGAAVSFIGISYGLVCIAGYWVRTQHMLLAVDWMVICCAYQTVHHQVSASVFAHA